MQLYTQVLFIRVHNKKRKKEILYALDVIFQSYCFQRSDSCLLNITLFNGILP